MGNISKSEEHFIRESIAQHIRMDTRNMEDKRAQKCSSIDLPMTEKAIKIEQGSTVIEMCIVFKSTAETLEALDSTPEDSQVAQEGEIIDIRVIQEVPSISVLAFQAFASEKHGAYARPPLYEVRKMLQEMKVGLLIEVKVINDDGNLFDAITAGLAEACRCLAVPDIHNLGASKQISLALPRSSTYAIIGGKAVADPTRLEEMASEARIHVFTGMSGNPWFYTDGSVQFDSFSAAIQEALSLHTPCT